MDATAEGVGLSVGAPFGSDDGEHPIKRASDTPAAANRYAFILPPTSPEEPFLYRWSREGIATGTINAGLMNNIRLSAIFTVPPDALSEFKQLAATLNERVKETEPTTQEYLWFCTADESEWEVRENYPDSDSVLAHIENMGAELQKMMQIAKLDLRIYGAVNEALGGLAQQVGAKVLRFDSGISR